MVGNTFTSTTSIQQLLLMLFTFDNFIRALCGAIGSATSITILYPLEIIRTRLQINDPNLLPSSSSSSSTTTPKTTTTTTNNITTLHIIRYIYTNEGLQSLYKGYTSLVLALSTTNFVFFYTFHALRHSYYYSYSSESESSVTDTTTTTTTTITAQMDLLFSAIAGIVTVFITNPLWVVNTRLKLQQSTSTSKGESKVRIYRGIYDCFKCIIIYDGGIHELWSGTTSSILLISNPMIQFVTYEYLKRITTTTNNNNSSDSNQHQHQQQGSGSSFLLFVYMYIMIPQHLYPLINGSISKVIATITTYPLQLLQTLRRAGMLKDDNNDNNNNKIINQDNDNDNTSTTTTTMISSSSSSSSLSNDDDDDDGDDSPSPSSSSSSSSSLQKQQRQQQQPVPVLRRRHSLMKLYDQGTTVVQNHGIKGLFRGLESKLLQTGLNAGLMFLIYEELSTFILYLAGIEN